MDIKCNRRQLAARLAAVSRFAPTRTALPMTGNTLLRAEEDQLTLTATDRTTTVSLEVPGAVVQGVGSMAVPARFLADLVKTLASEEVALRCQDGSLQIAADCFDTRVRGFAPDEFPVPPGEQTALVARIPAKSLAGAIRQVHPAAATDGSQPILTGMFIRLADDAVTLAAADGYRLAEAVVPLDSASVPTDVVVPAATMVRMARLLSGQTEPVEMLMSEANTPVTFRLTGGQVSVSAIEGCYPDYREVIPSTHNTRAVCDRQALLQAVRLANVFAADQGTVRLTIADGEQSQRTLTVGATSVEGGDNTTLMDADVSGGAISTRFTCCYLIDALSVLDEPQVALEFVDGRTAVVVRPVGAEQADQFMSVLMPVISVSD